MLKFLIYQDTNREISIGKKIIFRKYSKLNRTNTNTS